MTRTKADDQSSWPCMSGSQKAQLLRDIHYTMTAGDDLNISMSNAAREIMEGREEFVDRLFMACIEAIEKDTPQ